MEREKNLQDLFATSAMMQRLMHAYIHRTFTEAGLAPSQLHLLQLIEHKQPVSLKKLADAMRLTPGAITQLVESLVQAGYVNRTPDEHDRRVSMVTLTESGADKLALLTRQKQILLENVAADLSDEELAVYLRVQQKMLAYLETNCRNAKR